MKNALVILAGGKGKRFGHKNPKQFYKIGNKSLLDIFFEELDTNSFDYIILSISKKYRNVVKFKSNINFKGIKLIFSDPGKTRQESSFNALKRIHNYKIKNVLIHDAARPFCSNKLINKILVKLKKYNNSIPYIEYSDRQIKKSNYKDCKTINIQTPQGFDFKLIYNAHKKLQKKVYSDDSSLIQELGVKIKFFKGEKNKH